MNITVVICLALLAVLVTVMIGKMLLKEPETLDSFGQVSFGETKQKQKQDDSAALSRMKKKGMASEKVLALVENESRKNKRVKRNTHFDNRLARKLRQALWPISPLTFRLIQLAATVGVFIVTSMYTTIFIQGAFLLLTPLLVRDVLEYRLSKRMEAFDRDYAVMLMQLVSFVKSGMMALPALEEAAGALEEGSLVRSEIKVMFDRIRMGLSEEQAIGAFGEDIPHPEIELFVQALILHTRLGGSLTPTLERLATQVRKTRHFRMEAVAAVTMERLSIYVVAMIMGGLMLYLTYNSPQLVMAAFSQPFGVMCFEGGVAAVIIGFYLSKEVTKLKL